MAPPTSTLTPVQDRALPVERHRVLGGVSRARILAALRQGGRPMTADEVASAVGLHPNTAREHLDRLISAGLAQRSAGTSVGRGRPRFRYEALPETGSEDAYRVLAGVLAEEIARSPDPAASIAEAGDRWGRRLARLQGRITTTDGTRAALERIMAILDAVGFAPSLPAPDGPIELRACPFRDLAEAQGDVVCGVHLGLMRGALSEMGAPLQATSLRPFVTPSLCLAEVKPNGE